jgi:sialate O-acetylesterase
MKRMKYLYLSLMALICFCGNLWSQKLELPLVFADHMVLQRDMAVPVWGKAKAGSTVTVEIANQKVKCHSNKEGKWMVKLSPMKFGGPYELKVISKETIILKDVLIGDVWVCSGQSNMEFIINGFPWADKEVAKANYPNLRLFTVTKSMDIRPRDFLTGGSWKSAIGDSIRNFSAIAYFFGRNLIENNKVPIGLISSNWGGTIIESWTSPEGLMKFSDFAPYIKQITDPSNTFEKMDGQLKTNFNGWMTNDFSQSIGIKEQWFNPATPLQDWKDIKVPSIWENTEINGFKGDVWYKTHFFVGEENQDKNLRLILGQLSEYDQAWVNGHQIGQNFIFWQWRNYFIPKEMLKHGNNELTLRIFDKKGKGGFLSKPEFLLVCADEVGYPKGNVYLLNGQWKYRKGSVVSSNFKDAPDNSMGPNSYPTILYNAMIAPLIPYGIKGVIWYQGESNEERAWEYGKLFPNMITDWRNHWKQGDFPFLYVQLANYHAADPEPSSSLWAELRESQDKALSLANVSMASAIDIGDANNIHPINKQEVGRRLYLAASKIAYHDSTVVYSGPRYKSMKIEGNKIILSFFNIGSGLACSHSDGKLKSFAIAGPDKKFVWADAVIDGKTIIVSSQIIANPVAVRYAWADNPDKANLINIEGLPASPFRTDEWPGITYNKTYMSQH